ncbi:MULTISPECIES: bifunctional protein-serine/threonine kinase/phosphatase [Methylobacterium]|uniref:Serine/threonine-protein kinase PknD n=1 Tax=Methylobacterium thuringiense TaxID=1003091 RepID=A0ABQ4TIC7_9HYPH|nr:MULTISPECIES: bifunctional protein-serine/threonine kinase/phosphatase [Methylobacterium]TXN24905.1 protein kinase [Methylobacterium sp. WL9]GJE54363.1 Serine/threonine-protein kinase PknD [Methylobacterium thuringiense]
MPPELTVSIGQHSARGRKAANQDFHGALVPRQPDLGLKGIAVALADGISSSAVGGAAAETAVKTFLDDYYGTPETWTVKTSAQRVITATNSWLHAETRRGRHADNRDKGYVTTFSALVLKARTAHLFHVGDARICRVSGASLERLTEDHRVVVSSEESYLGRALGVNAHVEIDHLAVPIECGDVFVLTTDGVHEHVSAKAIVAAIAACAGNFENAARAIVDAAYEAGSSDNLTVQIVGIDALPPAEPFDIVGSLDQLAPAPVLEPPTSFDGYDILRPLHASARSHVYLARDAATGAMVALKVPSVDLRGDADYLRRFMMEEWIARRIDNLHVLKAHPQTRRRSHLYVAMDYVDGQTLTQWMADHREPGLETVRNLVGQIARGVQAFHRREMVHRDLRPENILVDAGGTLRIIDFGSTKVAGVIEAEPPVADEAMLGTLQYTAPECFLGDPATPGSDIFSVGVVAYQLLTGRLPYGASAARAWTRASQRKLRYVSARESRPTLPVWVDGALRRAVHPNPERRYAVLSEFLHDLRHPNPVLADTRSLPLLERNPLIFWQGLSLILAVVVFALLADRVFWPPR